MEDLRPSLPRTYFLGHRGKRRVEYFMRKIEHNTIINQRLHPPTPPDVNVCNDIQTRINAVLAGADRAISGLGPIGVEISAVTNTSPLRQPFPDRSYEAQCIIHARKNNKRSRRAGSKRADCDIRRRDVVKSNTIKTLRCGQQYDN